MLAIRATQIIDVTQNQMRSGSFAECVNIGAEFETAAKPPVFFAQLLKSCAMLEWLRRCAEVSLYTLQQQCAALERRLAVTQIAAVKHNKLSDN